MTARFIVGDTRAVLETLPDSSVDLVLTSPPFLALRSYLPADHPDKQLEIGSEPTPGEFIDTLLDVVEACARVLGPYGTLAFELGDTYSGSGGAGGDYNEAGLRAGQGKFDGSNHRRGKVVDVDSGRRNPGPGWPMAKSLCLIPESFRWALVYGRNPFTGRETPRWRARNVVRWCRPNPPVGALGDKFRPGTSEMVIVCKSKTRWFDLDAVRVPFTGHEGVGTGVRKGQNGDKPEDNRPDDLPTRMNTHAGAPPLDWWEISTQGYAGSHYACVDSDTEALTPDGWRRHEDLTDGDLIAAYDADRGVIEWQPADFHRYPFDGELVAIDKRETVQRLTPNHRVYIESRSGGRRVVRADELRPSHRLPVAAPFDLPVSADDPGVERAALLGWFISEGSAPKSAKAVFLYQSATANPAHCDEIRRVLDAVGARYRERSRVRSNTRSPREWEEICWSVFDEPADWLRSIAPGKTLPATVLGWSAESCAALLDALIAGDGHTRPSGRRCFIQKDRDTIDMVQALVCRLGRRSTIQRRLDGQFSLTIGERFWLSLRGTDGKHEEIGRVHYEGTVWCPSVRSTFWLARRDGRPFITGNTWPEKLLTKPIDAMCPREVCVECGEPRRRIVDGAYVPDASGGTARTKRDAREPDGNTRGLNGDAPRLAVANTTIGWSDCGHNNYRRGIVLDPFCGSGTTLAVAEGLGRDSIGVDLDARNGDLARERVGMFLQVEESEGPPIVPAVG